MKSTFPKSLALGLLILSAFHVPRCAGSGDLLVRGVDSQHRLQPGLTVTVTPLSSQRLTSDALVIRKTLTAKTDGAGEALFTNVLYGAYSLSIASSPVTTFPIDMPNSNGVWLAHEIAAPLLTGTNDVAGYTRAQIDTKLAALPTGTNSSINTNDPIAFSDDVSVTGTLTAPNVSLGDVSAITIEIETPIDVRAGGTGQSNLTADTILVGDGTNKVKTATVGSGLSLAGGTLSATGGTASGVTAGFTNLIDLDEFWSQLGIFHLTNEAPSVSLAFEVRSTNTSQAVFTLGSAGGRFRWIYDPVGYRTFLTNDSTQGFEFTTGLGGNSIATEGFVSSGISTAINPLAGTNAPTLFNPMLRWDYLPLGSPSYWSFQTNSLGELQMTFTDDFGDTYTNAILQVDGSLVSGTRDRYVLAPDLRAATNAPSITNWINFRMIAHSVLTNLLNLASYTFTNQPAGGTNISVRTAGGTNFFDTTGNLNNWSGITTASKQQSNGTLQLLSSSVINFPTGGIQSNTTTHILLSGLGFIPTNSTISNIVIPVGRTNYVSMFATNNLTFTNYAAFLLSNQVAEVNFFILPQLIDRGINYGTLGAPGYGVRLFTNASSPMWTTLTNGKTYWLRYVFRGTNASLRISLEE